MQDINGYGRLVEGEEREKAVGRLGESARRVYDAVASYMMEHDYPPSTREIGEMTGLKSTSSVFTHLRRLEAAGLIAVDGDGMPRRIRVSGIRYKDGRGFSGTEKF